MSRIVPGCGPLFARLLHVMETKRHLWVGCNLPEIVPYLVYLVFSVPLDLTILQILSIDLGTDFLPAIGLGQEPTDSPGYCHGGSIRVVDTILAANAANLVDGRRTLVAFCDGLVWSGDWPGRRLCTQAILSPIPRININYVDITSHPQDNVAARGTVGSSIC